MLYDSVYKVLSQILIKTLQSHSPDAIILRVNKIARRLSGLQYLSDLVSTSSTLHAHENWPKLLPLTFNLALDVFSASPNGDSTLRNCSDI